MNTHSTSIHPRPKPRACASGGRDGENKENIENRTRVLVDVFHLGKYKK